MTNPRKAAIDERPPQKLRFAIVEAMLRAGVSLSRGEQACREIEDAIKAHDASIIRAYLENPPEEAVEEVAKWLGTHYGHHCLSDWEHENELEEARAEWRKDARALFKRLAEKKGE